MESSVVFTVEPVNLGDLPTLVIPSKERDLVRIPADRFRPDQVRNSHKKSDSAISPLTVLSMPSRGRTSLEVQTPNSTTDHKNVIRIGYHATLSEQFVHVPELPVNVPADGHGGRDLMDVALLQQDVPDTTTQGFHLTFG